MICRFRSATAFILIFAPGLRGNSSHDWPSYLGDDARSHYSTLAQINPSNVNQLAPAWTFRGGTVGPNQRAEMQCNPLVVDGVMYATLPGAALLALDAATGRELWRFDATADATARQDPRPKPEFTTNRNRGVTFWRDGEVDEASSLVPGVGAKTATRLEASSTRAGGRIIHTAGHFLFVLDVRTGRPVESFGDRGRVDFNEGLDRDPTRMALHSSTTPGVMFENLYVLSIRTNEGPGPSAPGHVRAFDLRTGKVAWTFRTIPHPGEFGYETWPKDAWQFAGGANCWAGMSIDQERALLFVPTGSPTYDYWGGNRPGENLFGNSLICLDARTGKRKWHFQFVHHDIWDRDLPAPPNLFTMRRPRSAAELGGTTSASSVARAEAGPPPASTDIDEIPAVAQPTKSGHIFVFHRETGEPLFPIEEVPVPSSDIPGEVTWPTQPLPVKPAPISRQTVSASDLTTRTPAVHRAALEHFSRLRSSMPFQPPSREGTLLRPGLDGGAEWGGAAVDPNGVMYINGSDMAWLIPVVDVKTRSSAHETGRHTYTLYCAGCHQLDRSGNLPQNIPALTDLASRMPRAEVLTRIAEGKGAMPSFAFIPVAERDSLVDFLLDVFRPGAPNPRPAIAAAAAAAARKSDQPPGYYDVPFVRAGGGRWLDADGYPNVKPPWGTLNAIDLNTGEYLWRVPLGEYPELTAQGIPLTGTDNYGGPIVTAGGLIFIAATRDEMIRAFDRKTGKTLWSAKLPAAGYATPTTYMVNGRQYLVIACGGGKLGTKSDDAYVAFALPPTDAAKANE